MLFNVSSSTTESSSISVVLPSDSSLSSSTFTLSSASGSLQPQSKNGTDSSPTLTLSSTSLLSAVKSSKKGKTTASTSASTLTPTSTSASSPTSTSNPTSTSSSTLNSSSTDKSTILLSSSEQTLIVSPSTVWIPNVSSTDSSEDSTATEETQMVTIVDISSTITSTLYPAEPTDQDHPSSNEADPTTFDTPSTATGDVETTPTWLLATTEIPSSETLVFYTRDYIFTDTSTTFTKKLPTRTVLPTHSSFTKPTEPVVTDTSYYQRWLSGGLDSNPKSSSSNKDSIIGGVVGCVGGLFVMLIIIYFLYKKRRKRNLLAHEKSFSHEVGRKMGYDDIDKFIGQARVSSDSITQLSPAAHKTYQSTKALPSTPATAPVPAKRSEADNPFNDDYLISRADVENHPQHSTSIHSSMLTSSSVSTDDGGETITSTTFTESIRNNNGYLTEIIES